MRDDDHEHVIVRQKTNWGTRKIYHDLHPENPDEPACLKHQKAGVEWRRQDPTALTDDWRECRYCAGTAGHGGATDPHELRDRLDDADPEDLGLAPIGEREGNLVTDGGREEPEKPITERIAEGGQYGDSLEDGERPVPDDVGPAPEDDEYLPEFEEIVDEHGEDAVEQHAEGFHSAPPEMFRGDHHQPEPFDPANACAECGDEGHNYRCGGCGLPLCSMHHELGGGFCLDCPGDDDPTPMPDGGVESDQTERRLEAIERQADALEALVDQQRVQNAVLLQVAHELRDRDDEMSGKGYAGWLEDRALEIEENVDLDAVDMWARDGGDHV